MKKTKVIKTVTMVISLLTLLILVTTMMFMVNDVQRTARVINYTGIIRGATQRLIKNELYGFPKDEEIDRLDGILKELETGQGPHNLMVLESKVYKERLSEISSKWKILKDEIKNHRSNPSSNDDLYSLSEAYFLLADKTVSSAEDHSYELANRLKLLEVCIVITMLFIVITLVAQIAGEMDKNRRLNSMAYVDLKTGLPNRRACEEYFVLDGPINKEENVCCFIFDLNNLKQVNDALGHNAGDALIASFANVLRASAFHDMFVGRIGGDEFIAIMNNAKPGDIEKFIARLTSNIDALNSEENENGIRLSYAYGFACSKDYPNHTRQTLMDLADRKMYENKLKMKKG